MNALGPAGRASTSRSWSASGVRATVERALVCAGSCMCRLHLDFTLAIDHRGVIDSGNDKERKAKMLRMRRDSVLVTLVIFPVLGNFAFASATPPIIIESLDPRSGPIGSDVVISGTGFSALAAGELDALD